MASNRYYRKSTSITVSNFYEQYQLGKYRFDPPYQRDMNVWDIEQKSFLLDTIFKNFPIPPIFLEQKIDSDTGITNYDVIDGKQRLSTIIGFINNEIPLPKEFGNDIYGNNIINGLSFNEIKKIAKEDDEIKTLVSDFWAYSISVEYIENPDYKIVDSIFDRLNREGSRLNAQELRKAQYYDTLLYNDIISYRSVNVQLAEKTGFSQEDAELLKEALKTLFENDASSARPEGSMEVCKMYWWQHDEKTPAVSSGKIQRGFDIKCKEEHPREFKDYKISWHVDGCKEPEEFDFV